MGRLISAFKQFSDGKGTPFPGGKLFFYANKTANLKDTWSDSDLNNLNSNPVILDGSGYAPPIFGQEDYTVTLETKDGVFVDSFDDVTPEGASSGAAFANWSSTVIYTLPAYVTGSDGCSYKATDASTNVDPTVDATGSSWEKIEFIQYWISAKTYAIGEQVKVSDNTIHISLINSNINNNPVGDAGVNWQAEGTDIKQWVTGRVYAIDDIVYGTDARLHKAVISQSGNNPVGDSGTNWLPNDGVTTKPVNTAPTDTATAISRMPTLTTNAYAVTGSTAAFEWAQYQLSTDSFATIAYDSGIVRDTPSHIVTDQLNAVTAYSMRVFHKGIRTNISTVSDTTTFTTTINFSENFDNIPFIGTGATQGILTSVNSADAVWITNTSTASAMRSIDTSRGVGEAFQFGVDALPTTESTGLTNFNANGFTVGANAAYNGSGNDIYSLSFKKQSGLFDILSYSGNSTNRTIAHNLGVVPGAMIAQQVTGITPGTFLGSAWVKEIDITDKILWFNSSSVPTSSVTQWNSTLPTSTVVSLGSGSSNQTGSTYIMYVIAHNPLAGVFCGEYTGTGSAGNVVEFGFPPAVVICFSKTTGRTMVLFDVKLGTSTHIELDADCEAQAGGPVSFNATSITLESDLESNASGENFGVIAFANPLLF